MTEIVWLSLDPVRRRIDFYPKVFSQKIELAFSNNSDEFVLGKAFFNATVHFDRKEMYQTTPGEYFARNFKQPGYRTVARIEKECNTVTVFGRRIHGEWRLCKEEDAECTFQVAVPEECVVDNQTANTIPRLWTPLDIDGEFDTQLNPLIIWQWCKRTDLSIHCLSDDMWYP